MKADPGHGMEGIGPEDLAWMGDDGNLDVDQLLEEHGFDQLLPLEYILLAIIDAYPVVTGPSRKVRLEKAMAALIGSSRRKRGMDEKDDYELLVQIGWKYHCAFWANGCKPPDVGPIIRDCVEKLPADDGRRAMAEVSSVVSRLGRKFKKNKDTYIARATEQMHFRRMEKLKDIEGILKHLNMLRIKTDINMLRPLIITVEE